MQDLRRYTDDVVHLDLGPTTGGAPSSSSASSLSIDDEETAEARIQRLIAEHPVIIFSRTSCYMCHVMKNLLATIGVHPTVIELDDHEIPFLPTPPPPPSDQPSSSSSSAAGLGRAAAPAVFIGGACVGGLESLVALHLSGHLIAKLAESFPASAKGDRVFCDKYFSTPSVETDVVSAGEDNLVIKFRCHGRLLVMIREVQPRTEPPSQAAAVKEL